MIPYEVNTCQLFRVYGLLPGPALLFPFPRPTSLYLLFWFFLATSIAVIRAALSTYPRALSLFSTSFFFPL